MFLFDIDNDKPCFLVSLNTLHNIIIFIRAAIELFHINNVPYILYWSIDKKYGVKRKKKWYLKQTLYIAQTQYRVRSP